MRMLYIMDLPICLTLCIFFLMLAIASQFGYPRTLENHNATSKEIIENLQTQFDFVLMGSYLDESLVVLKNSLNWSITDVALDVSGKRNVGYGNIPTAIKVCAHKYY